VSRALFRYDVRSNWTIWVIFIAIMSMYLAIILSMYDPENMEAMREMLTLLPQELVSAMGYDLPVTDLVSFMASYYYSFLILLFPMIYCIIVGNRLVAGHVDRGSMAYILSTPHSRMRIAATQALFLATSVIVLIASIAVGGLVISQWMFPGELDVAAFLSLNTGVALLFLSISAICFFFSCLFDDTKHSLALGGGLPVGFFVINMLSGVGNRYEWLRHLTLFSLYEPGRILSGGQPLVLTYAVLAGIAALLYGAGIYPFHHRDLPL